MTKPMKRMIIVLAIVFGSLLIFNIVRNKLIKNFFLTYKPPSMVISSATVKTEIWQPFISSVGTLQAVNGVGVTTQVPGIITKIAFESGQAVKQGQLLITIDDRVERANLEDNQAALKLANLNYKRQLDLLKQKATPLSIVDEAQAKLLQAEATVDRTQATIAQKNIVAPFSGKLGIRKINIGQYVSAGTEMVSLQSLNPLYLNFSLPEQYIKDLYVEQAVELNVDAFPDLWLKGKVSAINSASTVTTHNIDVQATIPNNDFKLYPGLFAVVKVILPIKQDVLTVPQTAVTTNLYGDFVFVIEATGKDPKSKKPILKVYRHYVKMGEQRDNRVAILKGVKAGEQVVTSGQLKLDEGTEVAINNSVNLEAEKNLEP